MSSKSSQPCKIVMGMSWDSFEFPENIDDDELQTSREDFEKRVGLASTRPKDTDSEGSDSEPDGVPPEYAYLFGSFPMEEGFSVSICKHCGTRIKAQCMEVHVAECPDLPEEERQRLISNEEDAGSLVELTESSIPGTNNYVVHRYGQVPKTAHPQRLSLPAQAPRSVRPHTSFTAPPSKSRSSLSQTEKDIKDVKPVLEKSNPLPSVAAIIKSKISSQSGNGPDLKPNSPASSPASAAPNSPLPVGSPKPRPMPKSVAVSVEPRGPNSPSSTALSKPKPSLILKISANTSSPGTSYASEGHSPSTPKAKTYSVSHSSLSVVGNELDSLPPSPSLSFSNSSSGSVLTHPATPVPTKASLKSIEVVEKDPPAKKKKKKKSKNEPRKVIPLKERSFNPNEHCGVTNAEGHQCKRSLTCKTHSMALRRAVPGRSQPFDNLLASHKKTRDEAKLVKQGDDLMVVKEILQSNSLSQDKPVPSNQEIVPFLDSSATVGNTNNSPRGRTILTSLLANCNPANPPSGRPTVASPKHAREQSQLPKVGPEPKKKKVAIKYKKDEKDCLGLELSQIDPEPSGFVQFDDIVPPDEELENCDVNKLKSLYNTSSYKNILDPEEEEEDLLPFPLIPVLVGRRKSSFPAQHSMSSISSLGPLLTYETRIDLNQLEFEYIQFDTTSTSHSEPETQKRRHFEDVIQLLDSSCIKKQAMDPSYFNENQQDTSTVSQKPELGFTPISTETSGKDSGEELRDFESLNEQALTDAESLKVSFHLRSKELCRPSIIQPSVAVVQDLNSVAGSSKIQFDGGNEGSTLVSQVSDLPLNLEGPTAYQDFLQQQQHSYPTKAEPEGEEEVTSKGPGLDPQVMVMRTQMPSLISSTSQGIMTFHMGGAITQLSSHNLGTGTVQYQSSEDLRDQDLTGNATWASLLEQVRVGIEQGRPEDAPVADSELSKLLAAQFED